MYQRLLEARGEREREAAKRREIESVRAVDETRARDAARGALAGAGFRIVARVLGPGVQVATHDASGPIAAQAANRADAIGHAHLAQLREARLLDAVVVRAEHIVEATRAAGLRRADAPAVTDRLCRLDRVVRLVEVVRAEVQQAPLLALVVQVVAERPVEQGIEREALVLNGVVPGEAEARQRVAKDVQHWTTFARLAGERTIDDRVSEHQRHVPRRLR